MGGGQGSGFAQSTDSNVNLRQNYPHRHAQNNVQPTIWTLCGPVELACGMIGHRRCCSCYVKGADPSPLPSLTTMTVPSVLNGSAEQGQGQH